VVVRKGNGEGYDPQFEQPLHDGIEFRVIEQRGGWLRIELADGNQGWVRSREVELF
jgi:SH3-like domain-containing protein